jgi:hypothetical protein
VAAPEDQEPESSWTVLPSVRDALGFQQYAAPPDRVRRDPETVILEVPFVPPRIGWADVSFKGVVYGLGSGAITAFGIGEGAAVLVIGGLGLVFDVCLTGWRFARGSARRSRALREQLGTTVLELSDESITCRSFDGSVHRGAWSEIDRVTVCLRGPGSGSVHVCWQLMGPGEEISAEVGPGVDFYRVYNALMRRAVPLEYVLDPGLSSAKKTSW